VLPSAERRGELVDKVAEDARAVRRLRPGLPVGAHHGADLGDALARHQHLEKQRHVEVVHLVDHVRQLLIHAARRIGGSKAPDHIEKAVVVVVAVEAPVCVDGDPVAVRLPLVDAEETLHHVVERLRATPDQLLLRLEALALGSRLELGEALHRALRIDGAVLETADEDALEERELVVHNGAQRVPHRMDDPQSTHMSARLGLVSEHTSRHDDHLAAEAASKHAVRAEITLQKRPQRVANLAAVGIVAARQLPRGTAELEREPPLLVGRERVDRLRRADAQRRYAEGAPVVGPGAWVEPARVRAQTLARPLHP